MPPLGQMSWRRTYLIFHLFLFQMTTLLSAQTQPFASASIRKSAAKDTITNLTYDKMSDGRHHASDKSVFNSSSSTWRLFVWLIFSTYVIITDFSLKKKKG